MRIIRKCAAILAVVMLFVITTVQAADEKLAKYTIEFRYDSTLGKLVGDVYLDIVEDARLEAGSFGIKYDPLLAEDVSFVLDTANFTYNSERHDPQNPYDPNKPDNDTYSLEDGSNYIAFSWGRTSSFEGGLSGRWHLGSIYVENVKMTTDCNGKPIPEGWHTRSMYQLDWLSTDISKADLFTKDQDGICLNREIWRELNKATDTEEAETGVDDALYGYYQGANMNAPDENGNPTWIDIGYDLDFGGELPEPPEGNIVTGEILSYNPKNDTTVTLYKEDGSEYGSCIAETKTSYPDGRVRSQYKLENVEVGTYILKVEKNVHLTYSSKITVTEGGVLKNVGQLYCGDLNGDGKIKLNDRSELIHRLNKRANASDSKYDLNGDGKITFHDLNILKTYYNKTYGEVG